MNDKTEEDAPRAELHGLMKSTPLPDAEFMENIGLYVDRMALSRIFHMSELFQLAVGVQGSILEFGTRWGQNLAVMTALSGIYEPYHYTRKIIGFDTFSGFPSLSSKDEAGDVERGFLSTTPGYVDHLEQVLRQHRRGNPIPEIERHELVVGDVTETVPEYLASNPHLIVSLAYFDMDLYEPTKACLEAIRPRLTKGSVLGFDDLNFARWPGETLAIADTLGLDRYEIRRARFDAKASYIVIT